MNEREMRQIGIKLAVLALSLFSIGSCGAETPNLTYKDCIVEVASPISENGFGSAGSKWITEFMIQEFIKGTGSFDNSLPSMLRVSNRGFYFYFNQNCSDRLKWSKYFVDNFVKAHEKDYYYKLKLLSPEEVDDLGIKEMPQWRNGKRIPYD